MENTPKKGTSLAIKNFANGLKTTINRHSLKKADWICENFRHPRNDRLPWSWSEHEYQIDIANEECDDVAIKKCAQVGLSELSIRMSLAWCCMSDYRKMAYILPTSKFAGEFSSTRFDPAIKSSSYVSGVVSKEVDNTTVKQIGTCFMVMRGTSGTTAAISIDLDWLLIDEKDFCNQEVLGSFVSRLQHSDLKMNTDFSTPTLPKYGISALYDESTQGRYMVRHSRCEKWVAPVFFKDVVIPGFDSDLMDFGKGDRFHSGIDAAYVSCPACRAAIDWRDFCDPDRRVWVHTYPDRSKKGYHVVPWDVPKYNTLPDVLGSIGLYKLKSDWVNFRLGLEHSSADNSFVMENIDTFKDGRGYALSGLAGAGVKGVFIGADLGKTSWLMVGVPNKWGGMTVICAEKVDVSGVVDANLGVFVRDTFRKLHGRRVIVDAAPNYETAMYLHKKLPEGQAYGAYYGGEKKNTLDVHSFNDATGVVTLDRVGSFDDTAKAVNTGAIRFADVACLDLVKEHLGNIKKLRAGKAGGGVTESWVSTGPDHFAHALNYLYAAYSSMESRYLGVSVVGGVMVGKTRVGKLGDSGGGGGGGDLSLNLGLVDSRGRRLR